MWDTSDIRSDASSSPACPYLPTCTGWRQGGDGGEEGAGREGARDGGQCERLRSTTLTCTCDDVSTLPLYICLDSRARRVLLHRDCMLHSTNAFLYYRIAQKMVLSK
eukprot:6195792-Pleurochrysis_carterae.AAC.6